MPYRAGTLLVMLNNAVGLPSTPSVWVKACSMVQMGDQLSSLEGYKILT